MPKLLNKIICGDCVEVLSKYTIINHIDMDIKFEVGGIAAYQSEFHRGKLLLSFLSFL